MIRWLHMPALASSARCGSLFTLGGVLMAGFGLAFSSGMSRIVLVVGGIAGYLYGRVMSRAKRRSGPVK
jgi:hypothetical protein